MTALFVWLLIFGFAFGASHYVSKKNYGWATWCVLMFLINLSMVKSL